MKHLQPTRVFLSQIVDTHDSDTLDTMFDEIREIAAKYGFKMSQYDTISLGLEKYSIGSCQNCAALAIDRAVNPEGLPSDYVFEDSQFIVKDGATFEGALLCEECLPTSHRWGHSS